MNENVLDIDKVALVDGDTITVNNGKLTGTNYHFGNGFHTDSQIGSATVNLDLKTDEDLSWNQSTATISSKITADGSTIVKQGSTLKGNYQAGQNISITGNTISANIPDVNVSSGSGVTVSGSSKSGYVISAQGTEISGGEGIICVGSPLTGYTISSIQPYKKKKEDDDPEEKNEDSEPSGESDPLTASSAPSTVSLVGPLGAALGAASSLIGAAPAAGAVASASSAFGAIGALAGAAGGVAVLGGLLQESGRRRQNKTNSDGTNIIGADGNPVLVDGSEVIIATFPKINDTDCDVTRLMFDKPPPCWWRGVAKEYGQQSVNLDILKEWDTDVNQPAYMNVISQNTSLLQSSIDTKFDKTGTLPFSQVSGLSFTTGLVRNPTTGAVSLNSGQTFNSVTVSSVLLCPTPIAAGNAANKGYVDNLAATLQPLNARLTNFGNIAPTNTFMLIASGGNFIQYSPADVRANLSLKNLSLLDTLDYTSSALVNKPVLGSLAALNSIDYTSTYITGKPTLGSLAALSSIDYASTYITGKPTLGSLAALSNIDYTSALLINKPTLGSLAAKSVINLASTDVTGILPFGSVDPNIVIAGTGLSKTAQTLSVNPVQTQITSVGTLTGLTVSGSSTFTGSITVPTPTTPSHAVTKSYVDGLISTTSGNAQPLNPKLTAISSSTPTLNNFLVADGSNFVSTTPSASRTALGLGSIALKNTITLTTDVTGILPYTNLDQNVALKSYVDAQTTNAGNNLTKTDLNSFGLSVDGIAQFAQVRASDLIVSGNSDLQDVTVNASLNVIGSSSLSGLNVTGNANVSGVLNVSGTATVSTPTSAMHATTKAYVDGLVSTAGTGLTKTGNVFSINASQSGITSLGNAASNVQIAGTTDSTSITSGALQVVGGVGVGKSVVVGGTVFLGGTTANLNTTTGQTLNINNAASTVVTSTLDSNAINAGSLQVAGGVGISKALWVGNGITVKESVAGNGTGLSIINSNGGGWYWWHIGQTSASGTNNLGLWNTSAGALQVAGGVGIAKNLYVGGTATLSVTTGSSQTALNMTGNGSNYVQFGFTNTSVTNSGFYFGINGSSGVNTGPGGFYLYNSLTQTLPLQVKPTSEVIISSVTDSSSTTTGALQVVGGLGVGKSVSIGGVLTSTMAGTGYTNAATFLLPNMATGFSNWITLGQSNTSMNCGQMSFVLTGTGSANNYIKLQIANQSYGLSVRGDGAVIAESPVDSSSTTTGALQVSGGVGIAKSLFAGSSATGSHTLQVNSTSVDVLKLQSLSASGFSTIGFLNNTGTVVGAFGYAGTGTSAPNAGNFFLYSGSGANFVINSNLPSVQIQSTADSTSSTSGSLQVRGGAGIAKWLTIGGGATNLGASGSGGISFEFSAGGSGYRHFIKSRHNAVSNMDSGNALDFYMNNSTTGTGSSSPATGNVLAASISAAGIQVWTTTDSTGVGTGALQVSGGASVAKNVYVGGNVSVLNTADATSTSGALVVSGGASVAKSLYVGSNLNVTGDLNSPALTSKTTLFPYPTTPATGSSWNGYTVSASSEYTYANGNGVDGYTGHPFDAYMNASIASRLRWATASTSTANLGLDGTTQSLHWSLLRLPSAIAMASLKLTAYLMDAVAMPTTFSVIAGTTESAMVTIATFSNIPGSTWTTDGNTFSFANTTPYVVWGIAWQYANQTATGGVAIRQIQFNQAVPKATLVSASANNIDVSGAITTGTVSSSGSATVNSLTCNTTALVKNDLTCSTNIYASQIIQSAVCIEDGVVDALLTNANGYTGGFGPINWKADQSSTVVASRGVSYYCDINNYQTRYPFSFQVPLLFSSTNTQLSARIVIPTSIVLSNSYLNFWTQCY
ncbi:uncharacterized protein EV422DRAFT_503636 [Fimicolochytrium jonesii]|uniref:uncharacterized protein n=1 Tax=Fimicolochytrium jonesii TaxID=1396493 RepID=UPI0022FF3F66|nr:uncharacterized protein EV422DRAFT_503636 [Fimicolochytrium jonesii]KAI8824835.1 hypothetical protein EV422DRAFT_503636 [Fimicolochytrium jonesii]